MADTKRPKHDPPTRIPDTDEIEAAPATIDSESWARDALCRTLPLDKAPPTQLSSTDPPPRPLWGNGVELVVVDETRLPHGERRLWRAAELWTKRSVYGLDSTFRCIEVVDRISGRPEPGHELLGARLGGGRIRENDTIKFSYPLPLPGMEGMFMKNRKHGYTSTVERMIVRIRLLHTASVEEMANTWNELASRWMEPPR